MNKKEFAKKYLDVLNSNNVSEIYHFFTSIAAVYSLDEYHSVALEDYVNGELRRHNARELVDVLDSGRCTKIKYKLDGQICSYIIEIDGKRISHLEFSTKR